MSRDIASGGLLKLMIRLPALRGELQVIFGRDETFRELTFAYYEATEMLARLQGDSTADRTLLNEYKAVCTDIENEVVTLCARRRTFR
jgi:hypothetical protein